MQEKEISSARSPEYYPFLTRPCSRAANTRKALADDDLAERAKHYIVTVSPRMVQEPFLIVVSDSDHKILAIEIQACGTVERPVGLPDGCIRNSHFYSGPQRITFLPQER